jgi:hypothetical protein
MNYIILLLAMALADAKLVLWKFAHLLSLVNIVAHPIGVTNFKYPQLRVFVPTLLKGVRKIG